jgi:feruloyl esterase
VINLTNPDLVTFFDRGGKLMIYHGWADPQVTPLNSVRYFKQVLKATGERRQGRSIELYMEPGVSHCWGGEGPDAFDVVGALEQWEETGVAPAQIIASQSIGTNGTRTRPLCPYPQVAAYTGIGSTDSAGHFRCSPAMPDALQGSQHQLAVAGHAARTPDGPSRAESRRSTAGRSGSPP